MPDLVVPNSVAHRIGILLLELLTFAGVFTLCQQLGVRQGATASGAVVALCAAEVAGPILFTFVADVLRVRGSGAEFATGIASDVADPGSAKDHRDSTSKKLLEVDKTDLARVRYAWPTIALALFSVGLWVASFALLVAGAIGSATAFFLSSLATYLAFTPMHDAVHSAVAPTNRLLNDAVGLLSSVPFFFLFKLFKLIHLMHHKHANDQHGAPDGSSLDPDHWAGEGPEWALPFRWATVFYWYLSYTLKQAHQEHVDAKAVRAAGGSPRPSAWLSPQTVLTMVAGISAKAVLCYCFGVAYVVCCVCPFYAASSWLMYVFDYVPHRPHLIPVKDDLYRSTSVTELWPFSSGVSSVLLLCQNYHNIHHLYPYLPFYKYGCLWAKHRHALVDRGTRVLPFVLLPTRAAYFSELRQNETPTLRKAD